MTKALCATLVTFWIVGSVLPAAAQPVHGPGSGRGPGAGLHGPGTRGSWNLAGYLDAVKGELAIASRQEAAWHKYADMVTSVGEQMQALHQAMFDAMPTASWEERRSMMNDMFQSRQNAFDAIQRAALELQPALDASQREKARTILPGLAPGRGPRRGPHGRI